MLRSSLVVIAIYCYTLLALHIAEMNIDHNAEGEFIPRVGFPARVAGTKRLRKFKRQWLSERPCSPADTSWRYLALLIRNAPNWKLTIERMNDFNRARGVRSKVRAPGDGRLK